MGLGSLKGMDPNQLKVVQSLLAKQQAGVAIPGLQHHQRKDPNEDPAVQLLSQQSGISSLGASQMSDNSMASSMDSAVSAGSNSMSSSMDSAMSSASSNIAS